MAGAAPRPCGRKPGETKGSAPCGTCAAGGGAGMGMAASGTTWDTPGRPPSTWASAGLTRAVTVSTKLVVLSTLPPEDATWAITRACAGHAPPREQGAFSTTTTVSGACLAAAGTCALAATGWARRAAPRDALTATAPNVCKRTVASSPLYVAPRSYHAGANRANLPALGMSRKGGSRHEHFTPEVTMPAPSGPACFRCQARRAAGHW